MKNGFNKRHRLYEYQKKKMVKGKKKRGAGGGGTGENERKLFMNKYSANSILL